MTLVNHWCQWTLHPNTSIRHLVEAKQYHARGILFQFASGSKIYNVIFSSLSRLDTCVMITKICLYPCRSGPRMSQQTTFVKAVDQRSISLFFFFYWWYESNRILLERWSCGALNRRFHLHPILLLQRLDRRELAQEWGIRVAFDISCYLSLMK